MMNQFLVKTIHVGWGNTVSLDSEIIHQCIDERQIVSSILKNITMLHKVWTWSASIIWKQHCYDLCFLSCFILCPCIFIIFLFASEFLFAVLLYIIIIIIHSFILPVCIPACLHLRSCFPCDVSVQSEPVHSPVRVLPPFGCFWKFLGFHKVSSHLVWILSRFYTNLNTNQYSSFMPCNVFTHKY